MVKNGIEKTYPKIIESLKQLREILGWTIQRVHDETDKAFPKSCPSLTSVKNVFKEGSENARFNYHLTIEPIERTMTDFAQRNGYRAENSEVYFAQRVNLQAVIEEKTALLNKLADENQALKEENERLRAALDNWQKEAKQQEKAKDYVKARYEEIMDVLKNITGGH